jgi:folate-binding protein YgfZ
VSDERRPPLETTYLQLGATWTTASGCVLPERFSEVTQECRAVREGAGVIDRSDRAWLEATGDDAVRFVHGMVSNQVKELAPGDGRYALLLDAHGHILADLYALRLVEGLLLETHWSLKERVRETLEKFIIADDVELFDRSDRLTALSVEGPAAGKLLTVAGAARLPTGEGNHSETQLADAPLRIVRVSETGEDGYRLVFAVEHAPNVWEALAGQRDAAAWQPVGHAALNVLRVEAGIPRYGVDVDERTLPPEAGLEARAISYNKGCYVGQETVERIRSRGHVNRRLVGLQLPGDSLPAPGAKLSADGKEVGWITSAVESPSLGCIALGYVRREYLASGTKLALEGNQQAKVAELPFRRRL